MLKWKSLGVESKLHILIQGSLIVFFILIQQWMADRLEPFRLKQELWAGCLAFQVLLSAILALFVRGVVSRNSAGPIRKLRTAMAEIGRCKDYSQSVEVDANNADIGDMAQSFNLLVEDLHLFANVFENSGEPIVITDAQNNIITVNRAFTQVTGYEREEATGRNPKLMSSGMHDAAFYQRMWRQIREAGGWKGEIYNRRKSGEIYPEWLSITAIRDASGKIVNYMSLFIDITSRKEAEKRIQFLAQYDALTKLPNRRLFEDRLSQAVASARRHGHKAALLFIDLDRFKAINDSLGHQAGDELLQAVADRLSRCVRGSDTVARMGGDEFVVILNEVSEPDDAARISQKMLDAMIPHFTLNGRRVNIGLSIGISLYPEDGTDGETLVKHADTTAYHAKACGRNNFQFFTPRMNARAMELISMETELREAISRQEFLLHYQPKVCAKSGRIVGVEALIRWRHPERGMVPPMQFIPAAEESGLILQMGEWVLGEACAQNAKWQAAGILHVPVAVNVSALQFHAGNFAELTQKTLHRTGLPPRYLEIEITEGIVMKEVEATIRTLAHLDAMGVRLSIDDFGAGYSSLSYLNRLPVDHLKIDKLFVQGITSNKGGAAITRAIIALGHHLELSVVAEGVETFEQYELLKTEGCDEIQGYYFSRPLTADEFIHYAAARGSDQAVCVQ